MTFRTEQEAFWAGDFGDAYIERNKGEKLITSNMILFGKILRSAPGVRSVVELGCNIGLNLQALNRIDPEIALHAYEINARAVERARALGIAEIHHQSVLEEIPADRTYDLAFTKGVLIHIHPEELTRVYDNLHALSRRYIMVCESFNPTPVTVNYRGNTDRLFKRDFAGELIDRFGLLLVDYGFVYRRDNYFPQDDTNWFLLEKPL
ncbi:MAG: pseudaminic acid biosynthesis-associated methylase [Phenylobacterium sp.]